MKKFSFLYVAVIAVAVLFSSCWTTYTTPTYRYVSDNHVVNPYISPVIADLEIQDTITKFEYTTSMTGTKDVLLSHAVYNMLQKYDADLLVGMKYYIESNYGTTITLEGYLAFYKNVRSADGFVVDTTKLNPNLPYINISTKNE